MSWDVLLQSSSVLLYVIAGGHQSLEPRRQDIALLKPKEALT